MNEDEQSMLLDLSHGAECIDIVTIVNFATISALREMIEKFHKEKNKQSTSGWVNKDTSVVKLPNQLEKYMHTY